MSLPGVESARRRRASHGRSAALMQPHPRLRTKPSAYNHHIEELAAGQQAATAAGHGDNSARMPSQAMEARRRLDEKLRAGAAAPASKISGAKLVRSNAWLQYNTRAEIFCAPLKQQAVGASNNSSSMYAGSSASSHGDLEQYRKVDGNGWKWMSTVARNNKRREGKLISRGSCCTAPAASRAAMAQYVQEECAICLESFLMTGQIMQVICLQPCSHVFHTNCLLPWLQTHSHCPFCRASIPKK